MIIIDKLDFLLFTINSGFTLFDNKFNAKINTGSQNIFVATLKLNGIQEKI